jgi:adiponectin receptor
MSTHHTKLSDFFTPVLSTNNNEPYLEYIDYYNPFDTLIKRQYLPYEIVPDWSKDNPYILGHYRHTGKRWDYYMRSIFSIHNETVNIWTHILAALGYLSFLIWSIIEYHNVIQTYIIQAIVFYGYIIVSFICFSFSTIMHTFYPISERTCNRLMSLDYSGIFMNMTSSISAFIYFSFYCDVLYQKLYFILLSTVTLIIMSIFIKYNCLTAPNLKTFRIFLFIIYGLSLLAPIIHRLTVSLQNDSYFLDELRLCLLSILFYVSGIVFYITLIPEKIKPGKFDLIGNSHNIFHILVLCGNAVYTYVLWYMMKNETENMICA